MVVPILSLLGLGSTAAGTIVKGVRPFLIPLTVALLALAFYFAYVRRPSRRSKITVWISTVVSAAAIGIGFWMH